MYHIDESFLGTDSSIAYSWIQNTSKEYPTFVQYRVKEIRESTEPHTWKLVDSVHYPADIGSRGCSAIELSSDSPLLKGPDFLYLPESQRPDLKPDKFIPEIQTEEKPSSPTITAASAHEIPRTVLLSDVIDIIKFGNLSHLIRANC